MNFISSFPNQDGKTKFVNLTPHDPIEITNDNNFTDFGFPGTGTPEEPYRIDNYQITDYVTNGIYVNGTTKHFVIINCKIGVYRNGILITNAANGTVTVTNNTCNGHRDYGIKIENSHNVTLENNMHEEHLNTNLAM